MISVLGEGATDWFRILAVDITVPPFPFPLPLKTPASLSWLSFEPENVLSVLRDRTMQLGLRSTWYRDSYVSFAQYEVLRATCSYCSTRTRTTKIFFPSRCQLKHWSCLSSCFCFWSCFSFRWCLPQSAAVCYCACLLMQRRWTTTTELLSFAASSICSPTPTSTTTATIKQQMNEAKGREGKEGTEKRFPIEALSTDNTVVLV